MATQEVKQPEEKSTAKSGPATTATENFWIRNQKLMIYTVTAVVVLVAGYFIYQHYVQAPKESKASEALWKAEAFFRMDSAALALNGDGATAGFLKVISRHSGTKAANLAKFYAGACYLKLGDYNNAIKYLNEFSTSDKLLSVRAAGLLGDAYAEAGKKQDAVKQYRKAGTLFAEDTQNSPEYLFRAGLLYQELGQQQEAISMFKTIKEKYATSNRGLDIDKYLAMSGSID